MENYASSLTGQQIDDAVGYILNNRDNLDVIKSYLTENKKNSIDNLLEYLTERQEKINNIISYLTEEENTEIETEVNEENTEIEVKPEIKKTKKEKIIDDIIEYLNEIGEDNSNRRQKIDSIIKLITENQNNIINASNYLNNREDNALQNKMDKIDDVIEYLDIAKQENINNTIENFKEIKTEIYTVTIPINQWKTQSINNTNRNISHCYLIANSNNNTNTNTVTIEEANDKTKLIENRKIISCLAIYSGNNAILSISPYGNNRGQINDLICYAAQPIDENSTMIKLQITYYDE